LNLARFKHDFFSNHQENWTKIKNFLNSARFKR